MLTCNRSDQLLRKRRRCTFTTDPLTSRANACASLPRASKLCGRRFQNPAQVRERQKQKDSPKQYENRRTAVTCCCCRRCCWCKNRGRAAKTKGEQKGKKKSDRSVCGGSARRRWRRRRRRGGILWREEGISHSTDGSH